MGVHPDRGRAVQPTAGPASAVTQRAYQPGGWLASRESTASLDERPVVPSTSVLREHLIDRARVEHALGPDLELLGRGLGEAARDVGRERAEAAVEQAQQDTCSPLRTAFLEALFKPLFEPFLHALLQPALDRKPFHAGDVLHFAFSFNVFNILPQSLLELLR